ncbi:hypothetical protein N7461_002871 [Penicillium sp. DV-2018c]|nr:hypothetical protein N7461_002871 [Penicillium sp. DV-2018c]
MWAPAHWRGTTGGTAEGPPGPPGPCHNDHQPVQARPRTPYRGQKQAQGGHAGTGAAGEPEDHKAAIRLKEASPGRTR